MTIFLWLSLIAFEATYMNDTALKGIGGGANIS